MDTYFPFDPYRLPRSRRWIDGDYREWKGLEGVDDQDVAEHGGSGEEEEVEEEEDEFDSEDTATGSEEE